MIGLHLKKLFENREDVIEKVNEFIYSIRQISDNADGVVGNKKKNTNCQQMLLCNGDLTKKQKHIQNYETNYLNTYERSIDI